MTEPTPVLAMRNVDKSFGPIEALSGIDLKVYEGKTLCLLGDKRRREIYAYQNPVRCVPAFERRNSA